MRRRRPPILALLLGLPAWIVSTGVLFVGFLAQGLQCDETCHGEDWRTTRGAWQWDGLLALGITTFVAGTALIAFVAFRLPWAALVSLLVGTSATIGGAIWWYPGGLEHLERHQTAILVGLAVFFAAFFAVRLAAAAAPGPRSDSSA